MKRLLLGVAIVVGIPTLVGTAMGLGAFLLLRSEGGGPNVEPTAPAARRQVAYRKLIFNDTAALSAKTGHSWTVHRTFHPTGGPKNSRGRIWIDESSLTLEEQVYQFNDPSEAAVDFKANLPANDFDKDDLPNTIHVIDSDKAEGRADSTQLVCITNTPMRKASPSKCFRWVLWRQFGQYNVRISLTMPSGGPTVDWKEFSVCASLLQKLVTKQIH